MGHEINFSAKTHATLPENEEEMLANLKLKFK